MFTLNFSYLWKLAIAGCTWSHSELASPRVSLNHNFRALPDALADALKQWNHYKETIYIAISSHAKESCSEAMCHSYVGR